MDGKQWRNKPMKTETYQIHLPKRTGACTVEKHHDRIVFDLIFSNYDDIRADASALHSWWLEILSRYRDDPRAATVNSVRRKGCDDYLPWL
jgi:hypothetical protein